MVSKSNIARSGPVKSIVAVRNRLIDRDGALSDFNKLILGAPAGRIYVSKICPRSPPKEGAFRHQERPQVDHSASDPPDPWEPSWPSLVTGGNWVVIALRRCQSLSITVNHDYLLPVLGDRVWGWFLQRQMSGKYRSIYQRCTIARGKR
jgi:hypothetical protein